MLFYGSKILWSLVGVWAPTHHPRQCHQLFACLALRIKPLQSHFGLAAAAGTSTLAPKSVWKIAAAAYLPALPLVPHRRPSATAHRAPFCSYTCWGNTLCLSTETMQERGEKKTPQTHKHQKLGAGELRGNEPWGWKEKAGSGKGWEPLKLALLQDKMLM